MDIQHVLEFYQRVLPPSGTYYLLSLQKGAKRANQSAPITDLLTLAAQSTGLHEQGRHVWYGTGTFGANRTKSEVNQKRCLYVDIDCGEGKPYATVREGIKEFFTRVHSENIPKPSLVVVSGNGFHPYWVMKESISYTNWAPLADALETAMKKAEIHVDPVVTCDAARVLRVPGSTNWKDPQNPKSCFVVDKFTMDWDYEYDYLCSAFGLVVEEEKPALPSRPNAVSNDDLSAGTEVQRAPGKAYRIFKECPMYRNAAMKGGVGVSEPLWQNQLLGLAFTSNGDKFIHQISNKHAAYSPRETERKFAAKQTQALSLNGPPRCETFENAGATECGSCQYRGRIPNPILLNREPEVTLPNGYSQSNNGVFRNGTDDHGPMQIFPFRIVGVQLVSHIGTGTGQTGAMLLDVLINDDLIQKIEVPSESYGDSQSLAKHLSLFNIGLQTNQKKPFYDFMASWINELNKRKQYITPISQFGWVENGFAVGKQMFLRDGATNHTPIRIDPHIGRYYTPKGELGPWKQAAHRVIHNRPPEYQVALATAFAAPLMKLTGISGCLLSLMSPKSGTGKSTALRVAQAVWGDPQLGVNALNDTANAVAHKLGIINNLPAYWDELRVHADVRQFLRVVFSVSQGKEKSRMTGATGHAATGSWATLITSASNESVLGHVDDSIGGSDAGRYRIFEILLKHYGTVDNTANKAFAKINDNYGHAGVVYAKWLAENRKAAQATVDFYHGRVIKEKLGDKDPEQDERFWHALIATLVAGAKLAKDLELVNFDPNAMYAYLVKQLNDHRHAIGKARVDTNAVEVLKSFLADNANAVIHSDYIRSRVHPNVGLISATAPQAPYVAQHGHTERAYVVRTDSLRNWMGAKKNDSYQRVYQQLKEMGATETKAVLGSGIPGLVVSGVRQKVLRLDLALPAFSELYDDDYD